jgi:hypothetical protein
MQETPVTVDVWTFRDTTLKHVDISGYKVEALDGSIGKVDDATYEVGSSHIVVDTGPWIFGKKILLPAGVVQHIDPDEEQVFVNRTKDQIKDAPEYDDAFLKDDTYRSSVGDYYGPGGSGYRDWDDASRN